MNARSLTWTLTLAAAVCLVASVCKRSSSVCKRSSKKDEATHPQASDLHTAESVYSDVFSSYNSFYGGYANPVYNFPPPNFSGFFGGGTRQTPAQRINCGHSFPGQCEDSRYRTFDGSCNNLRRPTWGMANTRYGRFLSAMYGDGVKTPTLSITGEDLPLSRLVSYRMFPDNDADDAIWNLAAMQWGQVMTHDMAMLDGTTQGKAHMTRCCTDDGMLIDRSSQHSTCYPIVIPQGDPVYGPAWIQCLNFVRSRTDLDHRCTTRKAAEQINVVTHFLDLSLVYGSNDQTAASLRANVAGRLLVDIRSNREWLPAATNKSGSCDLDYQSDVCYRAGDARVNQNPQLTVLQIILLREHNRVAGVLAKLNPHWNDETIYQETRRITIASYQHISYWEWLPIFLGMDNLLRTKILVKSNDYVNDYDASVNPSVLNEHSTAAFRYFHTQIAGYLRLVNKDRYSPPGAALRLSDYFNKPGVIEEGDNMDDLTRSMGSQPCKASDENFDTEITRYLFRNGTKLGRDLRATDIQRNRDHGLASYNRVREYCGLKKATEWKDFMDLITPEMVSKLSQLYITVDDVDLVVGGALEKHQENTLAGPTYLCIMIEQFYRTRVADRFWYERGDPKVAFTIEQLTEIRKATVSRLFCDNGDRITKMQPAGFRQITEQNNLVDCNQLPVVNLAYWKDYGPESLSKQGTYNFQYKKK